MRQVYLRQQLLGQGHFRLLVLVQLFLQLVQEWHCSWSGLAAGAGAAGGVLGLMGTVSKLQVVAGAAG
jgi:hypothetical protein